MSLLKEYIHCVDIVRTMRDNIIFSDSSLIRMYDDNRLGIRLRGTWNKWAKKIEFPVASNTEPTAELLEWAPQAVKGWLGFEEISEKPEGTEIGWRVSNGTNYYWWNGADWSIAALRTEWNTEEEISVNISTFPYSQKYIRLKAKLTTIERFETPILYGYKLLISASFDWFEDLIIRSLKHRLDEDFVYPVNFSGVVDSDTDRFNIKTDDRFMPEQSMNVTGIEAVYNDTDDPNHNTNILSTFDPNTGEVILTELINEGKRLESIYEVTPDVVINFPSSDYTEIGKTPVIVLDNFQINGRQVNAALEIALKDLGEGRKLEAPLWVRELRCNCTIYTGSTVDSARLFTNVYSLQIKGATQRQGHKIGSILKTEALDLEHSITIMPEARYNPKPNISDLKESNFVITIHNFYAWLRDIQNMYIITNFNYSVVTTNDAGPNNHQRVVPLNAGVIPALYKIPEIEGT